MGIFFVQNNVPEMKNVEKLYHTDIVSIAPDPAQRHCRVIDMRTHVTWKAAAPAMKAARRTPLLFFFLRASTGAVKHSKCNYA